MSSTAVFQTATIESLRQQLGDSGPGLLQELIGLYLLQARDLVGQIEDAVAAGDVQGRRSLSHKLRGSTTTLGGDRLAAVCLRLETVHHDHDHDHDLGRPDPAAPDNELAATTAELRGEFQVLAVVLNDYRQSLRIDADRERG